MQQALQAQRVPQVQTAQSQDHKAQQVQQALQALQVPQVQTAQSQDHKAQQVPQGQLERREIRVLQDFLAE